MMTRTKEIELRYMREDTSREVLVSDIRWLIRQNILLKNLLVSSRRKQLPPEKLTLWQKIKAIFSEKDE